VAGVLLAQVAAQVAAQGLKLHSGSVALDCVLAFILFTFTDYWSHRLFHGRTFWPLHRMHHSATEMTALTLWRNHPTAPVLEVFFKVWPLMLFDAPAAVVAGVGLGVQVYQHLVHSNIAWHWGWFGRWVLQPPAAHRLHHAMDPVLHDRNLGIPVVWDRLFGTWADPRQAGPHLAIGVADSATNTGRLHLEAWQDLKDCAWQVRQVLAAGWHRSRAAFAPGTASGKAPPPPPG
jgi:sterol desaturase/sphingolipid hydroxylase (fatty acid hydroxylase superfamily)